MLEFTLSSIWSVSYLSSFCGFSSLSFSYLSGDDYSSSYACWASLIAKSYDVLLIVGLKIGVADRYFLMASSKAVSWTCNYLLKIKSLNKSLVCCKACLPSGLSCLNTLDGLSSFIVGSEKSVAGVYFEDTIEYGCGSKLLSLFSSTGSIAILNNWIALSFALC